METLQERVAGGQSPSAWRRKGFPTGGWVEPKPDGDATGQDPFGEKRLHPFAAPELSRRDGWFSVSKGIDNS